MSASLVGSEMCIRDSCASADGGVAADAVLPRSRRGCPREQGEGDLPPVSYTHLTLPTICSV
eukprot:14645803-Alexandrium_andersonii.AAC.1